MKANCSACHRPIRFVTSMIGERTICPHCRQETTLPSDIRQIELEDEDRPQPAMRDRTMRERTMPGSVASPPPVSFPQTRAAGHGGETHPINYGPAGFECPYCHTRMLPYETKRISTAGWVTFAVLLIVFFPLFWIGFFMTEPVRKCSGCGHQLG